MGACYDDARFNGKLTREELRIKYADYIDGLLYEYGHCGYSGTLKECSGLIITNEKFATQEEAAEWLSENTDKWEAAKAVRIEQEDGKTFWLIGGCCSS